MFLNKHNLKIAELLKVDRDSKYAIDNLFITERDTAVTNGIMAVIVTVPASDNQSFPAIEGLEPAKLHEKTLLSKGDALSLAKLLLKEKRLTALNQAQLGANVGNQITFGVTDLDTKHVVSYEKQAGQFPVHLITEVAPKLTDVKFSITVNLHVLIPLLKQLEAIADDKEVAQARLSFTTDEKPVRIDVLNKETGQQALALVMPMRQQSNTPAPYPGIDDTATEEKPKKRGKTK